jgi:hypothetical protein
MTSTRRSVRVDLTQDLPHRARSLSEDVVSKIFGGCIALWEPCTANGLCCSTVCSHYYWISKEQRWTYACVPRN